MSAARASIDVAAFLSPGALRLAELRKRGGPAGPVGSRVTPSVVANLANNESSFGPSPLVLDAVRAALAVGRDLNRYPTGATLRAKLARRLGVEPAMVAIGNGSNELLQLIGATFSSPDVEVLCPRLGYAMFAMVGVLSGARVRIVPGRDWGHDLDALQAAVTDRTRLIFLANPNNPTATTLDASRLRRFLREVPPGVLVVLDEAYRDYVADDPEFPDGVALLASHPNLIVTRTFSKAHGLASFRVGYAVAAAPLIGAVQCSGQPNNVNRLGLVAAEAALDDPEHVVRVRDGNRVALASLSAALGKVGIECMPSAVNFLIAHFGPGGGDVIQRLEERGVQVGSLSVYGLPEHARITVGTVDEHRLLVAALADCLVRPS